MIHLIDKDIVVAEIEKRLHANGAFDEVGDEAWTEDVGMCNAYKSILSFLDTIETKEVDSTDAFIQKACEWLKDNYPYYFETDIEQEFKKAMKGE